MYHDTKTSKDRLSKGKKTSGIFGRRAKSQALEKSKGKITLSKDHARLSKSISDFMSKEKI